jgi:hypothetical protein
MNGVRISMLILCCGMLASCASASKTADKPVVFDQPDAKSRLALQNAICKSLGVAYVVLAEDALTHDNTLIIEPARIRDFQGRLLQGRENRLPESFHLVRGKKKDQCVLIYDRTGARTVLADSHCKAK